MNQIVSKNMGSLNKTAKTLSGKVVIDKDKNGSGLSAMKKGQQISGVVTSVGEQVTFDFNGQKVRAPKDVVGEVKPGEVKIFEILKTSKNEIELKILNPEDGSRKTSFRAKLTIEADWETVLAKKEQSAKRAGQEQESKDSLEGLKELETKLTERDYKNIEQEGFDPQNYTIQGLQRVLDRVKKQESQKAEKLKDTEDKKKQEVSSAPFGPSELKIRLEEVNLPATSDNIAKLTSALSLLDATPRMDDKAMQNLISKNLAPTTENLYKAYYSSTKLTNEPIASQDWSELLSQVKEVIKEAGFEVTESEVNSAKWLVESKIPLTPETLTYKKELEQLNDNRMPEEMLNRMLEGMSQGLHPKDAVLTGSDESAGKLVEKIKVISEDSVSKAVETDTELTLKNLIAIQENSKIEQQENNPLKGENLTAENEKEAVENEVVDDKAYKEVRAKRQLEEIRLKMTIESASKLEKQGFSIETNELSKVVDALKQLEDNYYKELALEADAVFDSTSRDLLKETTQSIEALKNLPSQVLGSTLTIRNIITMPDLLTEGNKLQAEFAKAGAAYETLMTVPNSEYGDSIKKAFAKVDSLLEELQIENTEQNRRAARILGYNQMEINESSIGQVKAYDQKVTNLINNLHPAVTVRMLKEQLNPMQMTIDELNQTVNRIREEEGISSEEKFSTFLHKLEKTNDITSSERKAYIGVYRLLYNVEKSDGAAVGALLKANQEVTLEGLLRAVNTSKKGHLDAVIDDEFGTLQGLTRNTESIAEQVREFTAQEQAADSDVNAKEEVNSDNEAVQEQTEYVGQILKGIKEGITPSLLKNISSKGIWNSIKDVPVEKLFDQLSQMEDDQMVEEEYSKKVQEIRELCKNSEQALRFLNNYSVPNTPANLMMANYMLSNGESPIKKLLKLQKEEKVEKSENALKDLEQLSDTLIDRHSAVETYTQLEQDAEAAIEQSYSEEKIDNQRLAELKSLGQQMRFLRTLAEKEFYQIPIETKNGITNMNLTILRGVTGTGKVSVTTWSEQLGNVKTELSLKENGIRGFIGSDNRSGLEQMSRNSQLLRSAVEEQDVTLKQLDFVMLRNEKEANSYTNQFPRDTEASHPDTERTLYQIAKAFIQFVRDIENSST
ncbi:MAG: DUF6240 domain-containing protein [Mobilitalea sp.]